LNAACPTGSPIEAQLPYLAQQSNQLQLRNRQIHAEIGLTMALGGGFRAKDPAAGPGLQP
jgi:outer membrane protein TolC